MRTSFCTLAILISTIFASSQTISYDFEDGSLEGWLQHPEERWEVTEANPLSGLRSMKHAPTSGSDIDRISFQLPSWDGDQGSIVWRFILRHRFNPSGTNHWAVFLTSDKDAEGMITAESPNGYVVGVNLTGTDDTLRLYSVTNGSFSPILTSNINWEDDIGSTLSSIGAVEVERKPDGTFTLKASTSGTFATLTPQGSVTDNQHAFSNHFGIYYRYTTSAAGFLMVDDISVTYKPVNPNDHDAIVINPQNQISSGIISSLATTTEMAVEMFKFRLRDQGTSDNLPTHTTKLRFTKVNSTAAASWPETIGGIALSSSTGNIPILETYIQPNAIEVDIDQGAMTVNNNSTKEFSLLLYLKPENITDGATIQLQVDSINHGWEADFNGTEFAEIFPSPVTSNVFTIQVIPTHLSFSNYPSQLLVNEPFSATAHATDVEGNRATTFSSSSVVLSLAQGNGNLTPSSSLVTNAEEGIAIWSDITYSERDVFRLAASTNGLETGVSGDIQVINDTTTIVAPPLEQPESTSIASTITSPGKAKEVLRFKIVDKGENDEANTYISQIYFKRPPGNNMASFSRNIAGVLLKANQEIVPIGDPHILTASISVPITQGALVVPDGEEVNVSLYVFLKSSGLNDNEYLGFMIDSVSHSIEAYSVGSNIANIFPEPIVSNNFPIDVQATRLRFTAAPQQVGLEEAFSVEVSAVDQGGSVDINSSGVITLTKNTGDGWLEPHTSIDSLVDGKITFTDLVYYMAQPFTLLASSDTYDDVVSPLIYCSDRTTTILQPEQPLPDATLSTLNVTPEDAQEVLRFRIFDPGTTDGLPTFITQMAFSSFGLETDVSLSKTIEDVVVFADGEPITIAKTTISASSITLEFDLDSLVIPDRSEVSISLSIYLKKGGQIDGSTIYLHVPPSGHGWQSSPLGSGLLQAFEAGLTGPKITIEANATQLKFVEQPFTTEIAKPMNLLAAATDKYGSIDLGTSGDIILDLNFGPGEFDVRETRVPLISGVGSWSDVIVNDVGKFSFKTSPVSGPLADAISEPIWCGETLTCHVEEDFDDGYPGAFPYSTHWDVSTVSPIDGNGSLKHALVGVAGESHLSLPINASNLGDGPMEWSFVMRNGDWNPSSSNAFWFVLASDTTSIKLGDYNGYAVGVNLTGSSNFLTLWEVSKGKTPQTLIQSDFTWEEGETVWVMVTRTPRGEWSLWFQSDYKESTKRLAGKTSDTKHTKAINGGPVFKFTTTRAGELWIDNLKICSAIYPPVIQKANLRNLTTVDIIFSGEVNQDDAQNSNSYTIKTTDGNYVSVIDAFANPEDASSVSLRTEEMPLTAMMLFVDGIRSSDGVTSVNDSTLIGLGAAGTFGNIIINEIMARPSPTVGLPNVEFVELYNRTNTEISLNGWVIRGNNNYATIPDATVAPNDFIILSNTSGATLMAEYGDAVGIPSFPTLLVGGMFLAIYDEYNNLISWVEYSDTWYGDDQKKTGGYSLERIDPNNLVEGKRNWIASSDPLGGTPGRENSVKTDNPDVTNPTVVELKILDDKTIEIGFSEPMDSLSITLTSNYNINKGIGNPLWANTSGPKYNKVELSLASAISVREVYDICFGNNITDFSGNQLSTDCISFALPENPNPQDIVINEVLFNPYTGGVEFVELFNRTEKTFDLSKLWIANRSRTTLALNEYYPASDTAWLLLPHGYAVLSENPALVEQFYYVENPGAMVWTKRMPSYANSDGYVLILDELGDILDELAYNENMHNRLLADVKGVSLERIHPDLPTNDASSWQSAAQTSGFATPTAKNSQYTEPTSGDDSFTLSHQVFSPDGDGFEDVLLINYELPENGYVANIMVFDSRGRRVRRLAANVTLGTSGSLKWDGTTDGGRRAPIGAYVIFIEAFDLRGNVKRYKKTVVVATRFRD